MGRGQPDKKTLVSVVIPCYNYAKYLPEAIRSVMSQGLYPIEIIIVNDGSTDTTDAVARKMKQRHNEIKYIKQQNAGPSAARNAGLQLAKGDYVMCLDADDKLAKDFFKHCLTALERDETIGYAYTQMQLFGAKKEITKYPAFNLESLKEDNYIHISALFRKSALADSCYDVKLRSGFEDWDLYLTLAERGIYGVLVDRPLLQYRKHLDGETSITDQMDSSQNVWHTKLRIQVKHLRLVGLEKIFRTLIASIKHDSYLLKRYIKSKIKNTGNGSL